jgi:hypothetical protein
MPIAMRKSTRTLLIAALVLVVVSLRLIEGTRGFKTWLTAAEAVFAVGVLALGVHLRKKGE